MGEKFIQKFRNKLMYKRGEQNAVAEGNKKREGDLRYET